MKHSQRIASLGRCLREAVLTPGDARMGRTTDAFLRGMGAIYLIAFLSLWYQIDGLIGSQGILPAAAWADWVRHTFPHATYLKAPTLILLDGSDAFLHFLCATGAMGAVLLLFGIFPMISSALCWGSYLSLVLGGQLFLSYQWDQLLLEAGFLTIFLSPAGVRSSSHHARHPNRWFVWLARWLVFRLMFASGFVKLTSGDPAWTGLTALTYHYFTQPIPTWTAWAMDQLPSLFHKISAALVLLIECVLPFFIFGSRRYRLIAFGGISGLQLLILLTGNFGFFNLLSLVLCLMLLEDDVLFPPLNRPEAPTALALPRWSLALHAPIALLLLVLSLHGFTRQVMPGLGWPAPVKAVSRAIAPFRITATYGLFAVMTTARPEIEIEGSQDGEVWTAYPFKWKAGPVNRRPRFATPYMPRLDWQLWFAALGPPERNVWLFMMMSRLGEGSPAVLALLEDNPFPDSPPRYLRAIRYDYTFSNFKTLRTTGAWWQRERTGPYGPILEPAKP